MPTLDEIFVSNPVDDTYYLTLKFEHSVFENPHRFVINHNEQLILGEDESSIDVFAYIPVQGRVVPPEISTSGRQEFGIELDAVSLEIAKQLDDVLDAAPEPIYVTFAEYVASEPGFPKTKLRAVLVDPQVTETLFSATGAFSDPINKLLNSTLYTTVTHPGLV